jgi:branched-chain amino acid transport system ATP-binding protein
VGLAPQADVPARVMAHGEHRQLELAMALALQPKILLLDEPLAGMSSSESETMVALLGRLRGRYPMLLVEHDMGAVFALADRISVLVYGQVVASGLPEQIRSNPEVRNAYLGDEGMNA